jgi:hypothetical protein
VTFELENYGSCRSIELCTSFVAGACGVRCWESRARDHWVKFVLGGGVGEDPEVTTFLNPKLSILTNGE